MIGFFDLRYQPNYETLLNGLPNVKTVNSYYQRGVSGAAISLLELFTNADATISFLLLYQCWHNVEGANRQLSFNNLAGNILFLTAALVTGSSQQNITSVNFQIIVPSVALVNASTTFTFIGYKLIS